MLPFLLGLTEFLSTFNTVFKVKIAWPVIFLSLFTKDKLIGIAGCSLRRKQAGSGSYGTSLSGRNTGSLRHNFILFNTASADVHIHCGRKIKYPVEWETKQQCVTRVDPAAQAEGSQTTSEACESRHWCLQSPELPGRLSQRDFRENRSISKLF